MSNGEKSRRIYREFVDQIEGLGRGDSVPDVHRTVDRVYLMMSGGCYRPSVHPEGDWAGRVAKSLDQYCISLSERKKVEIAGAKREIATEDAAFNSLKLALNLVGDLALPHFREKSQFSNTLFHDIYNLSLAYVDSIVSGVSDQYISSDDAFDAKRNAVVLAKNGMIAGKTYASSGFSPELNLALERTKAAMGLASPYLLRPFENVATERKAVYKKDELTEKLKGEVTERAGSSFEFHPDFIFPIAQGGTELGIELGMAYEEQGADFPLVYPLMFSMKTRKQRVPWTEHDSRLLEQGFEGKNLLTTEDWVTTGNTLRGILNALEMTFPREIRVATLKRDPEKSQIPVLDKYRFYTGISARYGGTKTDSLADM